MDCSSAPPLREMRISCDRSAGERERERGKDSEESLFVAVANKPERFKVLCRFAIMLLGSFVIPTKMNDLILRRHLHLFFLTTSFPSSFSGADDFSDCSIDGYINSHGYYECIGNRISNIIFLIEKRPHDIIMIIKRYVL